MRKNFQNSKSQKHNFVDDRIDGLVQLANKRRKRTKRVKNLCTAAKLRFTTLAPTEY